MLQFNQIQKGNYLIASNDGDELRGEVSNVKNGEQQVCLNIGVQEFWYEMNQLKAIALNEAELINLKFIKQPLEDGAVKYLKGAFRILFNKPNDFNQFEIWYRDEHREIHKPLMVHELQNHFYEMTKVHLNDIAY